MSTLRVECFNVLHLERVCLLILEKSCQEQRINLFSLGEPLRPSLLLEGKAMSLL